MFETEIEAGLKGIKVKAEAADGIVTRICTLTVARDFDALIANALSGAKKIRAALEAGDVSSCVLPIDRLVCEIELDADGDHLKIGRAKGTKATCKAGDPDKDELPRIALEFEFSFNQEAWAFLGRHVGAMATLVLNPTQQEMDLGSRAEA